MDKEQREKREKTILAILDELSLDLEKTLVDVKKISANEEEAIPRFKIEVKSKVYYWLSMLYDEMEAREKNLEIALDVSKEIIKKLKESNQELQRPVFPDDNKNIVELVTKKIGDR